VQGKAPTREEPPPADYKRARLQNLMRNNQMLQSLGVSKLVSIINGSSAAMHKQITREDSDSLYEPEGDMEDSEHGVVDKVSERNTTVSSGVARRSKRVYMPPVDQDQITRITRQKTRQLLSTGDGLQDTPTNTTQEDAIAALSPNQAADQTEMCNEGEQTDMVDKSKRGRSMGFHLERMTRGLNAKIPVLVADGKRRPDAPVQAAKLESESGIIIKQHIPIYTHWKEYKKDQATQSEYMGRLGVKFTIDTSNKAVKNAYTDLLRGGTRQFRHKLKKEYFMAY